jgi:hypothetical protein
VDGRVIARVGRPAVMTVGASPVPLMVVSMALIRVLGIGPGQLSGVPAVRFPAGLRVRHRPTPDGVRDLLEHLAHAGAHEVAPRGVEVVVAAADAGLLAWIDRLFRVVHAPMLARRGSGVKRSGGARRLESAQPRDHRRPRTSGIL